MLEKKVKKGQCAWTVSVLDCLGYGEKRETGSWGFQGDITPGTLKARPGITTPTTRVSSPWS